MDADHREGSDSALRVLRSAAKEIEALRSGSLSPSAARLHILRVANSVDRSLRRMLRDDESADLSLRLKALAPDEIRIDAVLAELRRGDRLPMELAASIHELLESRRRLEGDVEPASVDVSRTVAVYDRLQTVLQQGAATRPPALGESPASPVRPSAQAAEPPRQRQRQAAPPHVSQAIAAADAETELLDDADSSSSSRPWILAAIPVAAVLALLAIWLFRGAGPDQLATGVQLFQEGEYTEAAQYFWRYAEDHPDDVTPQLYLARIHRRMNRPELAAEAIRAAESIAPDDPAVHRELGFLLLDAGQAETAVERFRKAIELDEQSSEGWIGLVRALRESGRDESVPAVIEQAPAEVRALLRRPVQE